MLNQHLDRTAKLEGFLKLDPGNADPLGELVECWHRGGGQERALEAYDRLIGLAGEHHLFGPPMVVLRGSPAT